MIITTVTSIAGTVDTLFNRVSLLLSGNGPNNGTNNTFLDSSSSALTVTRVGSATQGSFSPYAQTGWSVNFGTANGSKLTFPTQVVGTTLYTIECWVKPDRANTVNTYSIVAGNIADQTQLFTIYADGRISTYLGAQAPFSATGVIKFGVWQHIALVVNGSGAGSAVMYVNGTSVWSTNFSATTCSIDQIGSQGGGTAYTVWGSISNFRTVAAAVYTGNFTPPSLPLTAIPSTQILMCGKNRFADGGPLNKTVTVVGSPFVQVDNPFAPSILQGYAGKFSGGASVLSIADNEAFTYGTNNFTIEYWINPTSHPTNAYIIGQSEINDVCNVLSYTTSGFPKFGVSVNGSVWTFIITSSVALVLGAWSHVACVRNGTRWSIYLNGVETAFTTQSITPANMTQPLKIGAAGGSSTYAYSIDGYLSNVRIVNGTAVYTSAFTPSTSPLTAITNTVLLTCQGPTFVDNSTNGFTITSIGVPTVQPISPFPNTPGTSYSTAVNGGSIYLDGSSNYLTMPNNASYTIPASTNFTIEFWVYPTAVSTSPNFVCIGDDRSANNGLLIYYSNGGGYFLAYQNGVAIVTTNGTQTAINGQWYHVALVRSGTSAGNLKMYINGILKGTSAGAQNATITGVAGNGIAVGAEYAGTYSSLSTYYMSDLRIISGTALYTAAFIPPITPLTAITNTKLLLSGTNGSTIDLSGRMNLGTSANAITSTAASKFGGSSMSFNGTNSSINMLVNQNLAMSALDFTIEFWINPDATQGSSPVVLNINGGTNPYVQLGWFNASNWGIVFGNSWSINNGTPPTAGVWSHVAFVRSGTTITYYLNGVSSGTPATNTNVLTNITAISSIGSFNSSSNYYKGYLDDLRITPGVARYTTTFTPPSAAFPTK